MKVWINYVKGAYQSGLALIAADSSIEAHKCLLETTTEEYPDIDIHQSFFELSGWEKVPELTANVSKPTILGITSHDG